MNIIEVENLTYSYDKNEKNAVDGVSFSVPEGKYVTLIGHNGSGKSTLAKLLSGLIANFEGKITIFGKEVKKNTIHEIRKKMGLVFQNPDNQFVGSTVRDDIAFGLENRQVKTEEMDPIIDTYSSKVGMKDFLDKSPENLSGGQKQRVAIAGVLAMHPELIIYDEATSMLDPVDKKEILDITFNLRNENPKLTVLSITHDVEEAYRSDYVLVMNAGKLVLQGTPQEVFAHQEELRSIRLDAPFFFSLKQALLNRGISIPDEIDTEAKLEDFLCR
jgi:energy-coupling factor transport system ATP-binding protein